MLRVLCVIREVGDRVNFRDWVKLTGVIDTHIHRERLKCKDGFSMSVQAGRDKYSKPIDRYRIKGDYTHFEVLFPSEPCIELMAYITQPGVYAYVPAQVVEKIIRKHGGISYEI